MPVKVKVEVTLSEFWGADEAFDMGGPEEVKELVLEDMSAFLEEASWEIVQLPSKKE